MPHKVMWVSRHKPLLSQLEELGRLYGRDTQLIIDDQPFSSAAEVVRRFRESGADDMILVAPLSVLRLVVELGINPIVSKMERTEPHKAEVKASGLKERLSGQDQHYRFLYFRRLMSITFRYEDMI